MEKKMPFNKRKLVIGGILSGFVAAGAFSVNKVYHDPEREVTITHIKQKDLKCEADLLQGYLSMKIGIQAENKPENEETISMLEDTISGLLDPEHKVADATFQKNARFIALKDDAGIKAFLINQDCIGYVKRRLQSLSSLQPGQ
jgi:hypothetical protein